MVLDKKGTKLYTHLKTKMSAGLSILISVKQNICRRDVYITVIVIHIMQQTAIGATTMFKCVGYVLHFTKCVTNICL